MEFPLTDVLIIKCILTNYRNMQLSGWSIILHSLKISSTTASFRAVLVVLLTAEAMQVERVCLRVETVKERESTVRVS